VSLYHLDPRQAGTGAAPDVEVWPSQGPNGIDYFWKRLNGPGEGLNVGMRSEAAAIGAARAAAGFGDIPEKPCGSFTRKVPFQAHCAGCGFNSVTMDTCSNCGRPLNPSEDRRVFRQMFEREHYAKPCDECAWPRDAHQS
jgi:hypothetical protein